MPLTRFSRSRRRLALAVLVGGLLLGVSWASACTIPVFRYALERWESDRFLVIAYHDGPLTTEQKVALENLSQLSSNAEGPLNIEVLRCDLADPSNPPPLDLQPPSSDRLLPWVEVRSRVDRARTVVRWQGSLTDAIAQPGLLDSPARREIVQRILNGHSAVWLFITPEKQTDQRSDQLQADLNEVARDLALPQGIGLPGSELYAPIPLEIRYSVLQISHTDPHEQQLLQWFAAFTPQWRSDTAYVIPVFGRCRALDIIPYEEADRPLLEEIANFLCGACSCRVKQANPGFDLLASVHWNQRLFGEAIPPAVNAENAEGRMRDALPDYLAIPAGNQPTQAADRVAATSSAANSKAIAVPVVHDSFTASSTSTQPATFRETSSARKLLVLLVAVTLVGGGLLTGVMLIRR